MTDRELAAQGEHGYSAWDRTPNAVASRETRPIDEEVLLFEIRTGLVQSALVSGDRAELTKLGQELRTRDLAARAAIKRSGSSASYFALLVYAGMGVLFMVLACMGAGWKHIVTVLALAILYHVFRAAMPHYWRVAKPAPSLRWVLDMYEQRRCPDCEYDLSSSRDAIGPEQIAGQRVGPMMCSECQSKWPLVPARAELLSKA